MCALAYARFPLRRHARQAARRTIVPPACPHLRMPALTHPTRGPRRPRAATAVACSGLLLAVSSPAHAQVEAAGSPSRPAWLGEVSLAVGVQSDRLRGEASLADSDNVPPFATGEQPILRGEQTVPWLRLEARIARRHGLRLGWQSLSQDTTNPLRLGATYQVPFLGPITVYGNGPLSARTRIELADLSWRWWQPVGAHEFGLGLGVAYYKLDIDGRWEAVAELNPLLRLTWAQRFTEHTWAPELSAGWAWRPREGWKLTADLSGSRRNGGSLTGDVLKFAVGGEWSTPLSAAGARLALGAEYGWTHLSFERRAGATLTTLDLTARGPSVFMRLAY